MHLSMVCPTPPPWGKYEVKSGDLSLFTCLRGGQCRALARGSVNDRSVEKMENQAVKEVLVQLGE